MTVVVEKTPTTTVPEVPQTALASWSSRAGAFAVDVLLPVAVVTTMALVYFTVPEGSAWWWSSISAIAVIILLALGNRVVLPVITGHSLGRALVGIAVVRRDGQAPGPWRLLLRELAHLLDTASVVGWLWPLWDSGRRTFADMLLRTQVRRVEPNELLPNRRRCAAIALATAAALCVGGTAVSYLVVCSQERATDHSRAQIAIQGPQIVAQMLTYDPRSLRDDFAHALSLTTDKYRGQLADQQKAVQKGTPEVNEYRVADSAVKTVTPDKATMLMFLVGRRGAPPEARDISATVQVKFVRGGGGQWRVDDLTVLTKPKPPGNGK